MEQIINQLSEIEAASVKIIEHAKEQKKEISDRFERMTREFDDQVDQETNQKLADLNVKLKGEKDEELAKLRADTEQLMAALEEIYEKEHTNIAKKVVADIVKE